MRTSQSTPSGVVTGAGHDAHPTSFPATGATQGGRGRRTLQSRIELMLGIPSTVNELACLLNAPRRIVHATLHNLKKRGKAAVITNKYEDSTCRGRRCERHMAVWGTPGFRLTGFIKIPNT